VPLTSSITAGGAADEPQVWVLALIISVVLVTVGVAAMATRQLRARGRRSGRPLVREVGITRLQEEEAGGGGDAKRPRPTQAAAAVSAAAGSSANLFDDRTSRLKAQEEQFNRRWSKAVDRESHKSRHSLIPTASSGSLLPRGSMGNILSRGASSSANVHGGETSPPPKQRSYARGLQRPQIDPIREADHRAAGGAASPSGERRPPQRFVSDAI